MPYATASLVRHDTVRQIAPHTIPFVNLFGGPAALLVVFGLQAYPCVVNDELVQAPENRG